MTIPLVTRILVADDEPGIRTGLRRILQARGFDVVEAGSCEEAEQAFAEGLLDRNRAEPDFTWERTDQAQKLAAFKV